MADAEAAPPRPLTVAWLLSSADLSWTGFGDLTEVEERSLDDEGTPGVNSAISLLVAHGTHRDADQAGAAEVRLVTKRAAAGPPLAVARIQKWYQRERGFYSDIAPELPGREAPALRVPRCAALGHADLGAEAENFLLVLEHFGEPQWRAADPPSGCSAAEAYAAVRGLAWLHGFFLAEPARLSKHRFLPTTPVHVELADFIQDYYAGAWKQVREQLPEGTLPEAIVGWCDGMCSSYSLLLRRLAQPPLTLVHGDFRLENLRFSAGAGAECVAGAFDWQFCCQARGAYDLAYFLGLALSPQARREHEAALKEAYADVVRGTASKRAQTVLSELEEDLCFGVLLALASFIIGAATAPPEAQEMHHRSMSWLAAAALDWNAGRVLPHEPARSLGVAPLSVSAAM